MPYTIDNPPDRIKALPKHAQEIWISSFNNALKQYKNETVANRVAWSAVKAKYKQDPKGNWVEKNFSSTEPKIGYARTKAAHVEMVGEDEHFWYYKVSLTIGNAIMNGGFKPADEVRKIPKQLPEELDGQIPSVNDHPDGDVKISDEQMQNTEITAGFVTQVDLEDDIEHPVVIGIDHIPKTRPDIKKHIENNRGTSIGYTFIMDDTPGEYKGQRYDFIERDIKIYHNARMMKQSPACPPPYCGYQSEDKSDDELEEEWKFLTEQNGSD